MTARLNANKRAYCAQHGYTCALSIEEFGKECASNVGLLVHLVEPKPYMKFSLLLDCLRRFELAAWFDSDTAVVDFERPLSAIRDACEHKHFVVSGNNCDPPVRGQGSGINTGFMLVHHDAAGQYALKALLERTHDAEFVKRSFWWDQHALMDMIDNAPSHKVCVTPPSLQWFATTGVCMQRSKESFLVHWPATRGDPNAWPQMLSKEWVRVPGEDGEEAAPAAAE